MSVEARGSASGSSSVTPDAYVPRHATTVSRPVAHPTPPAPVFSSSTHTPPAARIPAQALAMDDFLSSSQVTPDLGPTPLPRRTRRSSGGSASRSRRVLAALLGAPVRFAVTAVLAAVVTVIGTFSYGDRGLLAAEIAAAVISVNYAAAFARRIGGRAWAGALLAVLVSGTAIATNWPFLLASAAVGTATLAAVLGVIATRPAATMFRLVREILIATGIALIGGLAATAYRAPINAFRARYLVIALALAVTVALVYRLGAGLAGLGRRGWFSLAGGSVALVVIVVYTEAFTRWESDSLRQSVSALLLQVDHTMGAIPRPLIFLVGLPALIWGIASRARRREGWWLTAFGAVGLAAMSTMFLAVGHPTLRPVLSLAYSITLGMFIGGLLVAGDTWLSGPPGRRTSKTAELARVAPEPLRHEPLL